MMQDMYQGAQHLRTDGAVTQEGMPMTQETYEPPP
jgi:hypothetical protein